MTSDTPNEKELEMPLATSRDHITHHHFPHDPLPTLDYAGRRLVIARNSSHRLIDARLHWWTDEEHFRGSCWRPIEFGRFLDATLSPDCVYIGNAMIGNVDLHISHLDKLAGFDELLSMLDSRIGKLYFHHGYDVATNTPRSLQFDLNGGTSVVHLFGQGVWHDIFQICWNLDVHVGNFTWAKVLRHIGKLPTDVKVDRGIGPMVQADFACPYDQIVEVNDHRSRRADELPSLTVYQTVRTAEA